MRMLKPNIHYAALLSSIVIAALPASAAAQGDPWPVKPLRWIVPFPPGGSTDIIARFLGPKLAESLGQQVIVDNRSGASGNIGTELVARAAPDGYTILSSTMPFVVNPALVAKPLYEVLRDFDAVMLMANQASFLGLHPSVPARTVKELIALARAKPGALYYGTAGIGSNPHIAGELFNMLAGVNTVAVHFKGGAPALIAAMGGEISIVFNSTAGAVPQIRAGRIRAIAVTGTQRAGTLPEVPTIAEAGLPGYAFQAWHVMAAPKGTPKQVIGLLNDRIKAALKSPDLIQRFKQDDLDIIGATAGETAAFLAAEVKKWSSVVKQRGMRAE
jgi:tripartite-type tricarboxylate transporter receptor subunit TctC